MSSIYADVNGVFYRTRPDTSSDHEQPGASNVRTKNKYFTINTTLQQQSDHHYTDIKLPDMQQSNTTVLSSNHPHHDLPTRIRKSSEKLSFENYLQGWKSLGTTNEASNCADSTSITIFEGGLDFSEPSIKGRIYSLVSTQYFFDPLKCFTVTGGALMFPFLCILFYEYGILRVLVSDKNGPPRPTN